MQIVVDGRQRWKRLFPSIGRDDQRRTEGLVPKPPMRTHCECGNIFAKMRRESVDIVIEHKNLGERLQDVDSVMGGDERSLNGGLTYLRSKGGGRQCCGDGGE